MKAEPPEGLCNQILCRLSQSTPPFNDTTQQATPTTYNGRMAHQECKTDSPGLYNKNRLILVVYGTNHLNWSVALLVFSSHYLPKFDYSYTQ
jgi:hypothetical protein